MGNSIAKDAAVALDALDRCDVAWPIAETLVQTCRQFGPGISLEERRRAHRAFCSYLEQHLHASLEELKGSCKKLGKQLRKVTAGVLLENISRRAEQKAAGGGSVGGDELEKSNLAQVIRATQSFESFSVLMHAKYEQFHAETDIRHGKDAARLRVQVETARAATETARAVIITEKARVRDLTAANELLQQSVQKCESERQAEQVEAQKEAVAAAVAECAREEEKRWVEAMEKNAELVAGFKRREAEWERQRARSEMRAAALGRRLVDAMQQGMRAHKTAARAVQKCNDLYGLLSHVRAFQHPLSDRRHGNEENAAVPDDNAAIHPERSVLGAGQPSKLRRSLAPLSLWSKRASQNSARYAHAADDTSSCCSGLSMSACSAAAGAPKSTPGYAIVLHDYVPKACGQGRKKTIPLEAGQVVQLGFAPQGKSWWWGKAINFSKGKQVAASKSGYFPAKFVALC